LKKANEEDHELEDIWSRPGALKREAKVIAFYYEIWIESRESRSPSSVMPKTSSGKHNNRQALRLSNLSSSLRL
jgi:hypothetical protein